MISGNNQQGVLTRQRRLRQLGRRQLHRHRCHRESTGWATAGGVVLYDAPDNTIGGTASSAGNVISGNNGDGILVSSSDQRGPARAGTVIQGNLIGLDATGSIALGNSNNGVEVDYGAGTRDRRIQVG